MAPDLLKAARNPQGLATVKKSDVVSFQTFTRVYVALVLAHLGLQK